MPLFDILQVWNRPSHHKLVYTFDLHLYIIKCVSSDILSKENRFKFQISLWTVQNINFLKT